MNSAPFIWPARNVGCFTHDPSEQPIIGPLGGWTHDTSARISVVDATTNASHLLIPAAQLEQVLSVLKDLDVTYGSAPPAVLVELGTALTKHILGDQL